MTGLVGKGSLYIEKEKQAKKDNYEYSLLQNSQNKEPKQIEQKENKKSHEIFSKTRKSRKTSKEFNHSSNADLSPKQNKNYSEKSYDNLYLKDDYLYDRNFQKDNHSYQQNHHDE